MKIMLGWYCRFGQVLCLIFTFCLCAPLHAQSIDPYPALMQEILVKDPASADLGALRDAYVATTLYNGTSRVKELYATALMENKTPFAGMTPKEFQSVMAIDYPLMEAHRLAFAFYNHQTPPDKQKMGHHSRWFNALAAHIQATAKVENSMTTYKVLSVGEEYEVLGYLGVKTDGAMLTMVDGLPFDVFKAEGKAIRFDISAFFGKF